MFKYWEHLLRTSGENWQQGDFLLSIMLYPIRFAIFCSTVGRNDKSLLVLLSLWVLLFQISITSLISSSLSSLLLSLTWYSFTTSPKSSSTWSKEKIWSVSSVCYTNCVNLCLIIFLFPCLSCICYFYCLRILINVEIQVKLLKPGLHSLPFTI